MPTSKLDTMIAERRRQRTQSEVAADHIASAEQAAREVQETLDPAAAAERERDKAQWLQMLRTETGYREFTSAPRKETIEPAAAAVDVAEPVAEPSLPVPPAPRDSDWEALDRMLVAAGFTEFTVNEYRTAFENAVRIRRAFLDPIQFADDRVQFGGAVLQIASALGTESDRREQFFLQALSYVRLEAQRRALLQVLVREPEPAPAIDPTAVVTNNSADARLDRIEAMLAALVAKEKE